MLISVDHPHIEHYRRHGRGWILTDISVLDDQVVLDSIGCTLSLMDIYRRVRF